MHDLERDFTKPFQPSEGNEGPRSHYHDWTVPWSDLMMVMFVLFVVLFIYADAEKDVRVLFSKEAANEASRVSALDPLIGLIGSLTMSTSGLGDDTVRVADNEVVYRSRHNGITVLKEPGNRTRVIVSGNLFFASGLDALQPGSAGYLDEISELVAMSTGLVHVVGYASADESKGMESFSLSSKRAENVAKFLAARAGVEPKRLTVTGRGAYQPQVPDTTNQNAESNRRVEILITNPR